MSVAIPQHERKAVWIIAAVQFVNILDFMVVMPLGPDFARDLNVPMAHLGVIGGAYTLAAALSGIASSTFLDKFDRRTALVISIVGLSIGTLVCAFAYDFYSLLAARVLAGIFGGPATSLSLAAASDVVPDKRRGWAMSTVMTGFAAASVFGVPAGLELAHLGGWRTPFIAICALAIAIAVLTWRVLPPMRGHIQSATDKQPPAFSVRKTPEALAGLTVSALTMASMFLIIPNISAYLQFNLDYPRDQLGGLYMVGGALSYLTMRIAGPLVDRWGATPIATFGTVIMLTDLYFGYIAQPVVLPVMAIFVLFMASASIRNVANTTQMTRIPPPHGRARFMSQNSAVQHLSCAIGAIGSAQLLATGANGVLEGIAAVACLAFVGAATLPFFVGFIEHRIRRRQSGPQITG